MLEIASLNPRTFTQLRKLISFPNRSMEHILADLEDQVELNEVSGDIKMEETSLQGRTPSAKYVNKQRTLVLCSRGIGSRERHLMSDLIDLLPHSKKDVKLDDKKNLHLVNELAEMKNCNNCIYFELRRRHDLYMWVSRVPSGPSVKFLVQNVHTMAELKLTGNCMKGSRPLLSFDKKFSMEPHWQLMKELLSQTFGSPLGHPKTKPFVDHVFSFSVCDDKIWFRNFQVIYDPDPDASDKDAKKTDPVLVEVGPRFVLTPMKILS